MSGISKIRYNVDKFFISPIGAPIYAIVDEEPTHIHLAKRIIDSDKTLTEILIKSLRIWAK